MPAAYYIISIQVALVAASAAYLRSDMSPGSALSKNADKNASPPARYAAFEEDEDDFFEPPVARRFALAEQTTSAPEVQARSMGFRPGAVGRERLPAEDADAPPRANASSPALPKAVPLEGGLPADGAQLSAVAPEEVEFDPVPDGQGYNITADSATNFDLTTKTVVFAGNVSLHCATFTLSADRLVVHMEAEGGSMNRMVANGDVDVKLTQGSLEERYHGTGEEAIYEPGKESIVLRGWPRIIGHGREHRAASATTKMTLFTNPGKLVTEGRAQTRILTGEGGELPGLGAR